MVLTFLVCSLITSLLIMGVGLVVAFRAEKNISELSSPFECGFDPVGGSRVGFSLRFFLILVLFVILDFETVLLLPSVVWFKGGVVSNWSLFCFVSFLTILLLGIFFELKEGVLQWKS